MVVRSRSRCLLLYRVIRVLLGLCRLLSLWTNRGLRRSKLSPVPRLMTLLRLLCPNDRSVGLFHLSPMRNLRWDIPEMDIR